MAKNITSVEWSATGLPNGLEIDKDTGKITGIPNISPTQPTTTYTANVTVKTNYGEDTKPITITLTIPESWKPVIDPNQTISGIVDIAITAYTVTGQNVEKTS